METSFTLPSDLLLGEFDGAAPGSLLTQAAALPDVNGHLEVGVVFVESQEARLHAAALKRVMVADWAWRLAGASSCGWSNAAPVRVATMARAVTMNLVMMAGRGGAWGEKTANKLRRLGNDCAFQLPVACVGGPLSTSGRPVSYRYHFRGA